MGVSEPERGNAEAADSDGADGGGEQFGRSSLDAFRAIAEHSVDLILRFDRRLRHVYINHAAERRMRRHLHAVRGRTQRELGMDDDSVRLWEEQLERVFRSGRERRFEFALGSSWVDAHEHFEALAVPERGARQEIETVLVIVRDVTERMRVQEELVEREATLANAQRIAGCGSFTWEPDGDALRGSAELKRLLRCPHEQPHTLAQLLSRVHADDRERVRRTLDEAARCARSWSMQFRVLDPDGVERVLHSRGEVAARNPGGGVCLHGTALDVTEQEDVQSTVRQLLRFSQFAVEHVEDAVLWTDESGRVILANGAAGERFGERAEALVGREMGRLGLKEPLESWAERWQQLRCARRLRYEVAQPGRAPIEITAHHATLHGQEYGCLVVGRERHGAATSVPELARDLLTPVQTILSWTSLIARTDDADTHARGLALIAESARFQQRLLETMLSLGGAAETAPDPQASHLLGDHEMEIRGVGQLRALRVPLAATQG